MLMKRTENSLLSKWWLAVDKTVLFTVLALSVFGVFMVWDTSTYLAKRLGYGEFFYVKKMLLYVPIGLSMFWISSCIRTRWIRSGALLAFPFLTIAMVATVFFAETKGARRWIAISGGFKIQPSELMKPVFAIVVAMILARIKDLHKNYKSNVSATSKDEDDFGNETRESKIDIPTKKSCFCIWKSARERNYILLLLGIFAMFAGILLGIQKDFGMTLTYGIIFASEVFVAGLSWFWISVLCGMSVLGLFMVLKFVPHVVARLQTFGDDGAYQLSKSLNAIRESNIFFGGHGNNLKTLIPDVHTDFIFAGIVEELSPVVAALIISVFFVFISHILNVVKEKKNCFVVCSVVGITSYIAFQILVNIASTLGFIPTKGMTLPFISYGGSSFISSCIAVGIILSLLQEQNLRR